MGFGKFRVLLVDDDDWVLEYLQNLLETEDYQIDTANTSTDALRLISHYEYDLVICDIRLKPFDGMECLRKIKTAPDPPEVIMITGYASIDSAVTATKQGAFDYLTKPFEQGRVAGTIRRALEHRKLVLEIQTLRNQVQSSRKENAPLFVSASMRKLLSSVDLAAKTDTTVLIKGETGTGKEVVAREIHRRSVRSEGPFIPVNCAALPESLMESELFGYKKGAFTGAGSDKKGLFESASGGTILLDEIGEMPAGLQAALLRVLQNGEIRPVGGTITKKTNTRVIATTNKPLKTMVEEGRFREDLYYRLRIVPLIVPPLRNRTDDILPLTKFFLDRYCLRFEKNFRTISPQAASFLLQHSWPGNVRELENLIHGIVALFDDEELTLNHITSLMVTYQTDEETENPGPQSGPSAGTPGNPTLSADPLLATDREEAEKQAILLELTTNTGTLQDVATTLGISRSSLWRKMKKYAITR